MTTSRKQKLKASKSWTVLFVGQLGNVVSFRLSKSSMVILAAGLVTISAFAAYAVVRYQGVRLENQALKNNLDKVEAQLIAANKAHEEAQTRLMLRTQKIKPGEETRPERKIISAKNKDKPSSGKKPTSITSEAKDPLVSAGAAKAVSSKELKPVDKPPPAQPLEAAKSAKPTSTTVVAIENPEIWQVVQERSVKFRFTLKNLDPGGRMIRGHTFVVLKPARGVNEPLRVSPWSPLKDGRPTIFKKGQYFGISHFKYIRGTFPDLRALDRFKTATIYVYSRDGECLLEEVCRIDEILRS